MPFSRYFGTLQPDIGQRQVRQIVQSRFNLDDYLLRRAVNHATGSSQSGLEATLALWYGPAICDSLNGHATGNDTAVKAVDHVGR